MQRIMPSFDRVQNNGETLNGSRRSTFATNARRAFSGSHAGQNSDP
jgi:hypothetical protein